MVLFNEMSLVKRIRIENLNELCSVHLIEINLIMESDRVKSQKTEKQSIGKKKCCSDVV